jgi:hypothetical protein
VQRLLNEVKGQSLQLQIQLDGSDAVAGASDFEVHVAMGIFHP